MLTLTVVEGTGQQAASTLMQRLRQREPEALENIYMEFRPYVMALAVRVLASRWEAEEVVQDVFLALWCRPPELLHGVASLIAWLAVATKRQCWLRLRRSERQPTCEQFPEDSQLGYSDPAFDHIAKHLLRRRLETFLRQITAKHRQILMLVYYEDKELTEVAAQLAIPVVTVRKWFALATLRLRRHFEVAGAHTARLVQSRKPDVTNINSD